MKQLYAENKMHLLQDALEMYVQVAEYEPDFFKETLKINLEPARFLVSMATTHRPDDIDEVGIRRFGLEWLVTYITKRPKYVQKNMIGLLSLTMECCMKMMLQLEDDPESFQEWASRLEPTGEGRDDDDEEEVFNAAKEAIDRIAEVVSMEVFMPILGQLIKQYSEQEDWKARHAALCAVQQCVEYVEDKSHIDAMVELCMKCAADVHPRVRHYALHGIGQIANDQAPYFQDTFYQSVMPLLLKCLDEQFDRVCAMAMSAFVSFGEELEPALMLEYSKPFMQKLVEKLHVSNHSGVQGESITSIAVIAGIIEKDFSEYYNDIMPMLKTLVNNPDMKDSKIRCKSFECISL